ncbi:uncharacterized protein ASCRUDRAFT_68659 [Ascoidea rubescens DSM 1968]|uniref:Uncharacterized protein n=1 Tax=Ascoidea rubescens DSM 1968 TaxID=1344418 RepID=A0A1D2VMK3_9ASCO|nr:hypothetical protein ASCRUDRAFT_68659 [Ascoidea rubescens DSM 1968]ODV62848.1 hypothetical protein ASCRUDRAFT_68659 [Ascoidea rubescens DSM 1968]
MNNQGNQFMDNNNGIVFNGLANNNFNNFLNQLPNNGMMNNNNLNNNMGNINNLNNINSNIMNNNKNFNIGGMPPPSGGRYDMASMNHGFEQMNLNGFMNSINKLPQGPGPQSQQTIGFGNPLPNLISGNNPNFINNMNNHMGNNNINNMNSAINNGMGNQIHQQMNNGSFGQFNGNNFGGFH